MGCIEIEQIGSPIRRRRDQRQTLIGLNLNKIGRVSWLPDIPSVRGMILKVAIFDANGIALETYDGAARYRGKTPDFKLIKDGLTAASAARIEFSGKLEIAGSKVS